jgi:hypothetical protein
MQDLATIERIAMEKGWQRRLEQGWEEWWKEGWKR